MPVITPSHELPVAQRTALLRQMLTLRVSAAHTIKATPLLAPGNEAILTGVLAVLGPLDTVIATPRPPVLAGRTPASGADAAVTVTFGASTGRRGAGSMSALVSGCRRVPPVGVATVDAWDVEAVLLTAARFTASVRGSASALLIRMCGSAPPVRHDPVAILAGRMFAERQLDAVGLRAITPEHPSAAYRPQIRGCGVCRPAGRDRSREIRVLIGGHVAPLGPPARQRIRPVTSRPPAARP
jgi:hypothetical protein